MPQDPGKPQPGPLSCLRNSSSHPQPTCPARCQKAPTLPFPCRLHSTNRQQPAKLPMSSRCASPSRRSRRPSAKGDAGATAFPNPVQSGTAPEVATIRRRQGSGGRTRPTGTTPATATKTKTAQPDDSPNQAIHPDGRLVQRLERHPYKVDVGGSSPSSPIPISQNPCFHRGFVLSSSRIVMTPFNDRTNPLGSSCAAPSVNATGGNSGLGIGRFCW